MRLLADIKPDVADNDFRVQHIQELACMCIIEFRNNLGRAGLRAREREGGMQVTLKTRNITCQKSSKVREGKESS